MRFSIVAAVYNEELYLKAFLDAVLNQTYKDYEVIIVDDGSTDASGKICDEYKQRYAEIDMKVIHQENAGVLRAKRNGLQEATGDYVVLLDSDDLPEYTLLESVAEALSDNNADVVVYRVNHLDADGNKHLNENHSEVFGKDKILYTGSEKKVLCGQLIDNTLWHAMWCKAVRRNIICADRGYEDATNVCNGEDLLQTMACFDAAESILCLNKALYNYRPVMTGLSKKDNPKSFVSFAYVYKVLEEHLVKWDMQSELPRLYRFFLSIAYDDLVRVIGSGKSFNEIKQRMQYIRQDSFYLHAVERLQGQAILPTRKVMIILLKLKCYGLLKGFLMYKELRKK